MLKEQSKIESLCITNVTYLCNFCRRLHIPLNSDIRKTLQCWCKERLDHNRFGPYRYIHRYLKEQQHLNSELNHGRKGLFVRDFILGWYLGNLLGNRSNIP